MPEIKISQLPEGGALEGTELVPVVQGGVTKRVTVADILGSEGEKQPVDALLTALSALVTSADKMPYFTGVNTVALATLSAFMRTLLDDADAAAARATLGAAPSASPTFTGVPTAPTAAAGTNTGQLASTAFVQAAVAALVAAAPSTLNTLNELAAALGDDPNFAATLTAALGAKAPLASPALTGVPTAPSPAADTNTQQIATAAFVLGQLASVLPLPNSGAGAIGVSKRFARQDHVHPADTSRLGVAAGLFMIRGTFTVGGGVITRATGEGFGALVRNAVGEYTINFAPGTFSAAPTILINIVSPGTYMPVACTAAMVHFQIYRPDTSSFIDANFELVAIGPE